MQSAQFGINLVEVALGKRPSLRLGAVAWDLDAPPWLWELHPEMAGVVVPNRAERAQKLALGLCLRGAAGPCP